MRTPLLYCGIFAAPFLFICSLASAAPLLNGISIHSELGEEVFIGAIYTERLSNSASDLLGTSQPARMELKIVAPEGMTRRRFSRLWIEGMAVNNRADTLTAQADNVVVFDGLFKDNLQANDQVSLSMTPSNGVSIQLNGTELGHIADVKFFPLLLSTWIGSVPLSSEYRDGLLSAGSVNEPLQARFNRIAPSNARIAETSAWIAPAPPEVVAPASSSAASSQALAIAPPPTPILEKPRVELPPVVAVAPPQPAKPAAPVAQAEEDSAALTTQSLLARQFYISDALRSIYANTRYPRRAQERGQEGNIRLAVVIDRKGNILSINTLSESEHGLLNREALDTLKRTAPFPALPDAIKDTTFEFTVPIRFVLNRNQ